MSDKETAKRAIALMDLTSLNDTDDNSTIDELCQRGQAVQVAAVCVWPRFVSRCRQKLSGSNIKVATVVNFPHGGSDIKSVTQETRQAIEDGTDEVDLVMPYTTWLNDEQLIAQELIREVKALCGESVLLKVILETGRLKTQDRIADASRDAIAAGADFLKTSTGKISVSATPSAAETMLGVIRDTERPVGFKAAGGIRTVQQAADYLNLADRIMGTKWTQPNNFRLGASSLLDACEQCIASTI